MNGKLGLLKAVYTGGYLVRNVEQVGDYTNYARGVYADYYQCYGPGSGGDKTLTPTCFSPSATWRSVERNAHQQHELRLSTPDEWRIRAIAGAFWEKNTLYDQTGWNYKTVPSCTADGQAGCFANIGTAPGASVANPGVQADNLSFYQDTMRDTKQTAFFASVDFDLIPKVLTLTLGTRHFRFQNSSAGSVSGSFDCFEQGVPPGGCLGDQLQPQHAKPARHRVRVQEPRQPHLARHTRPDGVLHLLAGFPARRLQPERRRRRTPTDRTGSISTSIPSSYQSDKLTNNEIGWKTEFFDHRLQWNGALYQENWDNVQVAFFDPGVVGNIFYNTNGQNFVIKGIETSLVARVMRRPHRCRARPPGIRAGRPTRRR